MRRRMLRAHTVTRAQTDGRTFGLGQIVQIRRDFVGIASEQDLLTRLEERLDAFPVVAHDRRATGCGLEQAYARRPARPYHVGPRDVQCVALRVVELAMTSWREGAHARGDVGPPAHLRVKP